MDVQELFDQGPAIISVIAALGTVILLPLFISQRHDIHRLRLWMERTPEHPRENLAASEALLDRAEAELEELLGEAAPATEGDGLPAGDASHAGVTPAAGTTPSTPLPATTRVTHERPALERITAEREALAPHPRWRHFVSRATQPRALVVVGLVAILFAAGGIVLSEVILDQDGDGRPRVARIERSEVTVAVLNGTSVFGLAGKVASDVEATGYDRGNVTNTTPGVEETTVLYADGQKPAAQKVARDLGVDPQTARPLDRESRLRAGSDAEVVVIAGEDRATP